MVMLMLLMMMMRCSCLALDSTIASKLHRASKQFQEQIQDHREGAWTTMTTMLEDAYY
jgi:hypothetical protein